MVELEGAAVAITGGARGIGRATAAAMAEGGARVWIGDLDGDAARAAADELGRNVQGAELDVTDQGSFASFLAAAGEVDVLVNNAGIMPLGPFLAQDPALSDRIVAVNLRGVITGTRLALPAMIERGRGHIANVASMMAKLPIAGAAVYTGTKYAVLGFTSAMRLEVADSGVTLSTILPTAVRTELVAGVPLGRGLPAVEPEEVAEAIVASCSNGREEVFVPRWLAGYEGLVTALPGRAVQRFRRLLKDDRAMHGIDPEARSAYDERIRPNPES